jgi:hypothetical protein
LYQERLAQQDRADSAHKRLMTALAVRVQGAVPHDVCASWARGVLAAREMWTADFDGEQFSLGRAFYTHLETGRAGEYFEDAQASDARVEEHAPGLQATLRKLLADAVRGTVIVRAGWCGAGVHIFPAGSPVACEGGIVHFDTEGLTDAQIANRAPALSAVLMLQPPVRGGGLRLWPILYEGEDHPPEAALEAGGDAIVEYGAGDLVLFDSYRCHQIQAFEGDLERVSTTLHVAQIDDALWESWF